MNTVIKAKLFVYIRMGNLVHRADKGWDKYGHIKGIRASHTRLGYENVAIYMITIMGTLLLKRCRLLRHYKKSASNIATLNNQGRPAAIESTGLKIGKHAFWKMRGWGGDFADLLIFNNKGINYFFQKGLVNIYFLFL